VSPRTLEPIERIEIYPMMVTKRAPNVQKPVSMDHGLERKSTPRAFFNWPPPSGTTSLVMRYGGYVSNKIQTELSYAFAPFSLGNARHD